MGWNNQVFPLLIITPTGGFTGLFIYSPGPGTGNLIGSWTSSAGVDPYGNAFPQGLYTTTGTLNGVTVNALTETLNPGPLLLYGNPNTVQVLLTGSGNWTAPAGVTSVFAEVIGGGGGGGGGEGASGGGGGGGGEYAAEPALAVTPTNNYAYSQGAAGTAGIGLGNGGAGGNTTFAGDSVTVTGHGGSGGLVNGPGSAGGTGSSNTGHFNGGAGGTGANDGGGGGGGSSAGTTSAGNNGGSSAPLSGIGGTGGAAPTSGGAGGAGGNFTIFGHPGSTPGGAGGGGGAGGAENGAAGAAGWIRLTYVPSGSPALLASLAGIAGTDPGTGTAYPAGFELGANLPVILVGAAGENQHGKVYSSAARRLNITAPMTASTDNQAGLILKTQATGGNAYISVPGAGGLVQQLSGTDETWHAMSLANGWSNSTPGSGGKVHAQYRLVASPPNNVEVIGAISETAKTSDIFAVLPAGYIPVSVQGMAAGVLTATGGAAVATTAAVECDASGNLSVKGYASGTTALEIHFHGFISLDA